MMKVWMLRLLGIVVAAAVTAAGCGYTTRSLLPAEFKSIYVDNFTNKINITAEQTNERMYRGYRPGMENDITRTTIDKFLYDGNLKIASESSADLILRGELTDFRKEPLRYDANNNVVEYRIIMVVNIELIDAKTGKALWKEQGFAGETTYMTSGSTAMGEFPAMNAAIFDLARRIVERTVEVW